MLIDTRIYFVLILDVLFYVFTDVLIFQTPVSNRCFVFRVLFTSTIFALMS